jgi:hypothetical protein
VPENWSSVMVYNLITTYRGVSKCSLKGKNLLNRDTS